MIFRQVIFCKIRSQRLDQTLMPLSTYIWINCCLCSEFKQDAKHGAEIKAVDAYCWLHSTGQLGYGVSDNTESTKVRHNKTKALPFYIQVPKCFLPVYSGSTIFTPILCVEYLCTLTSCSKFRFILTMSISIPLMLNFILDISRWMFLRSAPKLG